NYNIGLQRKWAERAADIRRLSETTATPFQILTSSTPSFRRRPDSSFLLNHNLLSFLLESGFRQLGIQLLPEEIGSERIQKIIDDMVKVMRLAPGVGLGLAAPQIGVPLRASSWSSSFERGMIKPVFVVMIQIIVLEEETSAQNRRLFDLMRFNSHPKEAEKYIQMVKEQQERGLQKLKGGSDGGFSYKLDPYTLLSDGMAKLPLKQASRLLFRYNLPNESKRPRTLSRLSDTSVWERRKTKGKVAIQKMKRFPYPKNPTMAAQFPYNATPDQKQTKAEKEAYLEMIKHGHLNIIVGTHSLLGSRVVYSNLGLLVVDEEHRFGVKPKEKIASFKTSVDVLTLSATPIPRTLYLTLTGFRDASLISTPPPERIPIKTHLSPFLKGKARKNELNRGGQVFYVLPRIKGLEEVMDFLEEAFPNMLRHMRRGNHGEICARKDQNPHMHIVESGLDIQNSNTINVQQFGLAQLYQLHGRVGRADKEAQAYLFYPDKSLLSDQALERLSALEECRQLGQGDVGNVGIDLFFEMLFESLSKVEELRIFSVPYNQVKIDININPRLPSEYVNYQENPMEIINEAEKDMWRALHGICAGGTFVGATKRTVTELDVPVLNCMHHSLLLSMYTDLQSTTSKLGEKFVKQLKDNRTIYESYVPMKYKRYYKRMAKLGEWGDHITLQPAADRFAATIWLLTSFIDTCFIEIMPQDQAPKRVLERLDFADSRRAESVCSSWYSAAKRCVAKKQIPWLILLPDEDDKINNHWCKLFNPGEKDKLYKIRDEDVEFANSYCLATYGNWLFMVAYWYNLYLLNIFTHERIDLPPVESQLGTTKLERTLKGWFCISNGHRKRNHKDIIIVSPVFWIDEHTKEYLVLWGFGEWCVPYSKKGDTFWNQIQIPVDYGCSHLVYKDQKLYYLLKDYIGSNGFIKIFDFSGEIPRETFQCGGVPGNISSLEDYQCETCITGDVLYVENWATLFTSLWSFRVYKVYSSGLFNKYEQVDSLGNEAMLFDLGITVLANDYIVGGFKRNSIYYKTTCHEKNTTQICLFNFETKEMEPLHKFDCSSHEQLARSLWFLPSFKQT
ncbi:LOW QUALITY PROTEIN: hypothetical protein HID58_083984, partial [Brassica napus]